MPKIELPGVKSLYDQIFEGPGDVAQASIDAFISDAPGAINESTNLKTASNQLVGVGVRRFDSPKYGTGRYWFVVIYASRAP